MDNILHSSFTGTLIDQQVDFRNFADSDENIKEDVLILDFWSKSITGSLLNFEENVELKKSYFFDDCIFLSCVFKKDVTISCCLFRSSLTFTSCLFLGKLTIIDSNFNHIRFSDNVFKSDVHILRNEFSKGNDILIDTEMADGNKFDIQPNFQNNVIHWP